MPTPEPEEELDFSDLTDDQIVELAVALAREAMRRNPALAAAFEQSLLDERARVEAAARGTEQAKRAAAAELEAQAKRAEAARQRAITATATNHSGRISSPRRAGYRQTSGRHHAGLESLAFRAREGAKAANQPRRDGDRYSMALG